MAIEAVQLLLKNGAKVKLENFKKESSLSIACRQGYTEIAKMLLSSGAEVNPAVQDARLPLTIAVRSVNCQDSLRKGGKSFST